LETDNAGDATETRVGFDSSGNALAVWTQSDGTRNRIWSNRYTLGTGWSTPALVETSTDDSYNPQIVVDASGNAIVAWDTFDGTTNHIFSNRYTAGSGWGTPVQIDPNTNAATTVDIAMDSNGNALAAWTQFDGTYERIWSNRYTVGSGWGTATAV